MLALTQGMMSLGSGNTLALLHMDGANGSTSFLDDTGRTWTANGNAQITTAQSVFGGASGTFDGTGDFLTTADSPAWAFGTGDFTVELRVRPTAAPGGGFFDSPIGNWGGSTGWCFFQGSDNRVYFNANTGGLSGPTLAQYALNTWRWHAMVRRSGVGVIWSDGVPVALGTLDQNLVKTSEMRVGANGISTDAWTGQLDEVRISNIARLSGDYTVPTSAPTSITNTVSLLNFDGSDGSTTFTDTSGKAWTARGNAQLSTAWSAFGTAALLLDGNGDWIDTPTSTDLDFGTGDFSIEAVIRPSALTNNYAGIFANGLATYATGARFLCVYGTSTPVVAQRGRVGFGGFNLGTDQALLLSRTVLAINTDYRVAVSRIGDFAYLWINGVLEAIAQVTGISFNFSATQTRIGANGWDGVAGQFAGRIDAFRALKGGFAYDPRVPVPTSPYTLD